MCIFILFENKTNTKENSILRTSSKHLIVFVFDVLSLISNILNPGITLE